MDPDTKDRLAAGMPVPAAQIKVDAANAANDAKMAQLQQQKMQAETEAAAKAAANANQ